MTPKNFIIKCSKCLWKEITTGLASDLSHLFENKTSCSNCGKPRTFKCPKCGTSSKMLRLKGGK